MDHFKLTYDIDTEEIHLFQHDRSKGNFKIFTLIDEIFLSLLQSLSHNETNLKLKVESI